MGCGSGITAFATCLAAWLRGCGLGRKRKIRTNHQPCHQHRKKRNRNFEAQLDRISGDTLKTSPSMIASFIYLLRGSSCPTKDWRFCKLPSLQMCPCAWPSVVVFWAPGAFVAGCLDDDELYALFLDLCRGQLGMPRRGAECHFLRPNHL